MSLLKRALQPAVNVAWRWMYGKPVHPVNNQRSFDAAQATRLLASWARDGNSLNKQLERELRPLRARSRNLCQNNEYAKGFITDLKSNVIGAQGVRFQCRSKNADGTLDNMDNTSVEMAFKKFSKPGQFEVSRRFDRATFERLLIETIARDGEAIIYKHKGFDNTSKFALRFIDADYLDERYSTEKHPGTGNRVRMGVEIDKYGAPVAYHFLKVHPGDSLTSISRNERNRVPAEHILHLFIPTYAEQARGVPWLHACMIGLRDLGGYHEAALIAARVGAAKMGFIASPTADSYTGDGTDADGNTVMEAEAGTFDQVPEGTTLLEWNPQYPHGDFEPFTKALLQGIAAGAGMSYHKLSRNLEGVNYSSGRLGELADRDIYMMLQNWIIEQFHEKFYEDWLLFALSAQAITGPTGSPLPFAKMEKWLDVYWQPRRWKWTDPQKEFNAIKGNIDERLMSRSQAIRDMGYDPEEVWREIQQEEQMLESLGVSVNGATGFIQDTVTVNGDQNV